MFCDVTIFICHCRGSSGQFCVFRPGSEGERASECTYEFTCECVLIIPFADFFLFLLCVFKSVRQTEVKRANKEHCCNVTKGHTVCRFMHNIIYLKLYSTLYVI